MRPPILLIHGACSHPAHMTPWAEYFRVAGYRCVVPALPGHVPTDRQALSRLTLDDYVAALGEVHARFDEPPIVMGHSIGGLLAQILAATADCAALVLLSSVPPGRIPVRLDLTAHALPLIPKILAGRPFRPSKESVRAVALHGLLQAEQDELLADFTHESGRAFRAIALGRTRVDARAVRCPVLCVAGSADRLLPPVVAERLAARYNGDHIVVPGGGHWLLAGSLLGIVARQVLAWIEERVVDSSRPSFQPDGDL
jgi:pimeloyl-ACP methyl ester carboxylesterase